MPSAHSPHPVHAVARVRSSSTRELDRVRICTEPNQSSTIQAYPEPPPPSEIDPTPPPLGGEPPPPPLPPSPPLPWVRHSRCRPPRPRRRRLRRLRSGWPSGPRTTEL